MRRRPEWFRAPKAGSCSPLLDIPSGMRIKTGALQIVHNVGNSFPSFQVSELGTHPPSVQTGPACSHPPLVRLMA